MDRFARQPCSTKVCLRNELLAFRNSKLTSLELLETVLFANIRFHDTVSRGRLLNRFGKDFEGTIWDIQRSALLIFVYPGIDSSLSDNFGRSIINGLSVLTTFVTISVVGGPLFIFAAALLGLLYWNVGKVSISIFHLSCYLIFEGVRPNLSGHATPRWLIFGWFQNLSLNTIDVLPDSVTRSPLYSIYGETISGVTILRAFGASSKFLRDMLQCVDTVSLVSW